MPTVPASRATRILFDVAMVCTAASVLMGSLVCATDSSAACPNWPGCYLGHIAPQAHLNPVIEFVHRVIAVSCGPLLLACGVVGLRALRGWRRWLPWVAVAGALAAGVFGMLTIKRGITTAQAALDLGCSLVAVVAITVAADLVRRGPDAPAPRGVVLPRLALLATLAYHALSVFVAGHGSLTRCLSWPVWRLLPADGAAAGQVVRLVLAAVAAVLLVATALAALRRPTTRGAGAALLAGLAAVAALTVPLALPEPSLLVKSLAGVAAGLVWWLLARVVARGVR